MNRNHRPLTGATMAFGEGDYRSVDNDLGAMRVPRRSAALRAEPVALSQARPAAAIASEVWS